MDKQQIIEELLPFELGDEAAILDAINNVNDQSNINEIMNYLLDQTHNNDNINIIDEENDKEFEQQEYQEEDDEFQDDEFEDDEFEDDEYEDDEFEDDEYEFEEEDLQEMELENDLHRQKTEDFMWRCHKCETWYFQSKSELCTNCIAFKELPCSFIKPGNFKYRPGIKADIITTGYIGNIKGRDSHVGIQIIAEICLQYLCYLEYDYWIYPVERFDDHGKDLSINDLNNRLQYRADHRADHNDDDNINNITDHSSSKTTKEEKSIHLWRNAFGGNVISKQKLSQIIYTFEIIRDVQNIIIGLIPLENAVFAYTIGKLSGKLVHHFSALKDDVVEMRVDFDKCTIEFLINESKIKKSKFQDCDSEEFKLACSLCRKYDGIEMIECITTKR